MRDHNRGWESRDTGIAEEVTSEGGGVMQVKRVGKSLSGGSSSPGEGPESEGSLMGPRNHNSGHL